MLGHRPLTHQDHREWESQSKEEGKKGCQSLVRRKDAGQRHTPHHSADLTCEWWAGLPQSVPPSPLPPLGHCPDTGPSPGPFLVSVCPAGTFPAPHFALQVSRKAKQEQVPLTGQVMGPASPLLSHSLTCLCVRGQLHLSAPFSMILQGSLH